MFRTRVLTIIVLLPLVVLLAEQGGLWFFALVATILTIAVIEFCQLMRTDRFRPAPTFAVALLWVLLLDAQFPQPEHRLSILGPGVGLVLMGSLSWQLAHREGYPVMDWALTMAGPLYVGWLGAHIIRLRALPEGLWWLLTTLPAIWAADSAAYHVGRTWGRRKLAPTLSPGKSWEGYIGGVVVGALFTTGLAALWGLRAGPEGPNALAGLFLGTLVATVAPLGDLVISMIKRQVGAKDTGIIFPGHGGALDRVDSILWAAIIGYYFTLWVQNS